MRKCCITHPAHFGNSLSKCALVSVMRIFFLLRESLGTWNIDQHHQGYIWTKNSPYLTPSILKLAQIGYLIFYLNFVKRVKYGKIWRMQKTDRRNIFSSRSFSLLKLDFVCLFKCLKSMEPDRGGLWPLFKLLYLSLYLCFCNLNYSKTWIFLSFPLLYLVTSGESVK